MPKNIAPQLRADLARRYKSGEINKTQYQFERARLEEKISRGEAIERSPKEKVFKWALIIGIFLLGLFLTVGMPRLLPTTPAWTWRIIGITEMIVAVQMMRKP